MENNTSFLKNESIGKLMCKYAIPCVISLLVGALYNIVDQIFIANADYLGSYGNAANTVVFPLTVIALAIVILFTYKELNKNQMLFEKTIVTKIKTRIKKRKR